MDQAMHTKPILAMENTMDSKVVTIFILAFVILLIAIFGIFFGQKILDKSYPRVDDYTKQELRYKNEKISDTISKNPRFWNKKHRSHMAKLYNRRIFRKAHLSYEAGEYKKAVDLFIEMEVDSLDPESRSAAYYYIASSLKKLNREKNALKILNKIVKQLQPNPWTTKAIILHGEINRKFQLSNEPLEVYLQKLYIETPHANEQNQILTQIGYLKLFRNDLQGAMAHFQRSNTPLSRLGKARVFIRKNEYWKAISIYEDFLKYKNLKTYPYFKDVKNAFLKQTYYYAKQWLNHKDYNHAYFYLRKIVNFFPNSFYGEAALFWLGEIFYKRRIYNTAIKYYNMVLRNKIRSKNPVAQFKKAMSYFYLKRYSSAIRNFQHVIDYYRSSPYSSRAAQWIKMTEREILYRRR